MNVFMPLGIKKRRIHSVKTGRPQPTFVFKIGAKISTNFENQYKYENEKECNLISFSKKFHNFEIAYNQNYNEKYYKDSFTFISCHNMYKQSNQ